MHLRELLYQQAQERVLEYRRETAREGALRQCRPSLRAMLARCLVRLAARLEACPQPEGALR